MRKGRAGRGLRVKQEWAGRRVFEVPKGGQSGAVMAAAWPEPSKQEGRH